MDEDIEVLIDNMGRGHLLSLELCAPSMDSKIVEAGDGTYGRNMYMMVDEHQEIQYIVVMYSGWEREGHLEKVKRDARVVTEARGVFASQDFEVIYNEKEIWINFGEEEIEKVFAKERIEIGYDKNDAIQYIKLNDMTEDEYEWLKYELKHGKEF